MKKMLIALTILSSLFISYSYAEVILMPDCKPANLPLQDHWQMPTTGWRPPVWDNNGNSSTHCTGLNLIPNRVSMSYGGNEEIAAYFWFSSPPNPNNPVLTTINNNYEPDISGNTDWVEDKWIGWECNHENGGPLDRCPIKKKVSMSQR